MQRLFRSAAGIVAAVVSMAGCGGGGDGGATVAPPSTPETALSTAASSAPIPLGDADCPNGGVLVHTGIDRNANGVLDDSEVTNAQKVCNGADGLRSLVRLLAEPAGQNCPSGGTRIDGGIDANGNGTLEQSEIAQTSYACNGAAGSPGANGLRSLLRLSPESAGPNCRNGGTRIDAGLDANGNGTLDAGEIEQTRYVCNASAGSWIGAQLIERDSGAARRPQIAFDGSGNATAVWVQKTLPGGVDAVSASRFEPAVGWTAPTSIGDIPLSGLGTAVERLRLAVNADGVAMAVVGHIASNGVRSLYFNRYVPGSGTGAGWGTVTQIPGSIGGIQPEVALDAGGNALVVWAQDIGGGVYRPYFSRFTAAGGSWSTPQAFDSVNMSAPPQILSDVLPIRLAMDTAGNAFALWRVRPDSTAQATALRVSRYTAGSGWGAAQIFAADTIGSTQFELAFDGAGNAIAVNYERLTPTSPVNLFTRRYTAATATWSAPQLLDGSTGAAGSLQLAVAANGQAMVVWARNDPLWSLASLWSRRYTTAGGWAAEERVTLQDGVSHTAAVLRMDANGHTITVWEGRPPAPSSQAGVPISIMAARHTPGVGWSMPQEIDGTEIFDAQAPALAVAPDGGAIALFEQRTTTDSAIVNTGTDIRASRYLAP